MGDEDCEHEQRCLRALVAGEDDWPRFDDLFGGVIWGMLRTCVPRLEDRQDIYRNIVLKLLSADCRVLRRFLDSARGLPFSALLRPIVRSAVVDFSRRSRLWRKTDLGLPADVGYEEIGSPERQLLREVRLHCIFHSLARRLRSESAYDVLALRFIDGLSVNEIAARLGLKPNAVSQRLGLYLRRLHPEYWEDLMELTCE